MLSDTKQKFSIYLIYFRYEYLFLGQQEFAVEYRDKLYFLLNEEARGKFMRLISKTSHFHFNYF